MPVFLRWFLNLSVLNPIAVRLVQNGSRRTRHLYIRVVYLGVLILVLLWSLLVVMSNELSYGQLAQAGASSFMWIAYLQVGLICVLAPVFMAGAIAQEASPRTWEVLLTTPMSGLQIVLGNMLGRLFFILALLFASLPLFGLTQYFGGVPGSAIFASYLVSASAATLVGAIAIALAVSRMAGTRSVFAFYVSVVSYLAVTAGIDAFLRTAGSGAGPAGQGVTPMTGLNPFLAIRALLNPTTYPRALPGTNTGIPAWLLESPVTFWCVSSLVLSVLLLGVSVVTVRTGGLGALTSEQGGTPWYRKLFGLGSAGSEHRAPRPVTNNPISWREATARNATLGRIIARYAFIAAGIGWALLLIIWYHQSSSVMAAKTFRLAMQVTVWGELAVITLVAINMSSTAVSREREDGTLDLLLTTAITPSSYLLGKLRGLVAYLLPLLAVPLGTLALGGFYVLLNGLGRSGGVDIPLRAAQAAVAATPGVAAPTVVIPTEPLILPEVAIIAPLVIIPFIAWCVMVGLSWSLKSKGVLGSVVGTVGVIGVIAGIVGLCAYKSAQSMPAVGPALGALSPATLVHACLSPAEAMSESVNATNKGVGLPVARTSLFIGSLVAAAIYIGIVVGMHQSMVRTFDTTVRKLAGQK